MGESHRRDRDCRSVSRGSHRRELRESGALRGQPEAARPAFSHALGRDPASAQSAPSSDSHHPRRAGVHAAAFRVHQGEGAADPLAEGVRHLHRVCHPLRVQQSPAGLLGSLQPTAEQQGPTD